MSELHDLLTRAASAGGDFAPPAGGTLRRRARRRSRTRGALAVVRHDQDFGTWMGGCRHPAKLTMGTATTQSTSLATMIVWDL